METRKTKKANLENKRALFFQVGLIVALVLVFSAFEWGNRARSVGKLDFDSAAKAQDDDMIAITTPEKPEAPAARPPAIVDQFIIVENRVEVPDFTLPAPDDRSGVVKMPYVERLPDEAPVDENIPYDSFTVDVKPLFMGGDENEFTKWVFKNLVYPEEAQRAGVQGRVTVQFVVNKEGNVTDIKVARSIHPALDREAVRVISMSPKWTPGMQRGKPVPVKYNFPVLFQLK